MIPNYFVQLEKLPLTTNGKIDKLSLPTPEIYHSEFEEDYIAPSSEIEEIMAEIWSEVLQIEKIGIYDNFLELGGNSLATIRIMTRINDKLELNLPLNKIFQTPTIVTLSQYVEETIINLLSQVEN